VPLALGFFGLGVGYLIYGPQELAGYPPRDRKVDVATGIWGIWMPGFLQFVTGVLLFVGLTWFGSFNEKPLYMAAVAFTAYGVHWWAIGMGRVLGSDPAPVGRGQQLGLALPNCGRLPDRGCQSAQDC